MDKKGYFAMDSMKIQLQQDARRPVSEKQVAIGEDSRLRALSPFTWTHLKLPALSLKIKPQTQIPQIKQAINKRRNLSTKQQKLHPGKMKQIKAVKLQSLSKTIDVDRNILAHKMKQQSKRNERYSGTRQGRQQQKESSNLKLYKKQIILKHLGKQETKKDEKGVDQKPLLMRSKSPVTRNEKTRSPLQSPKSSAPAHFSQKTYSFNKIEAYINRGFLAAGWSQSRPYQIPQLVWTDNYVDKELHPSQTHNHIKNSNLLTSKNNLHQFQSSLGAEYYPTSFSLPFEYHDFCGQYEQNLIKIALRLVINQMRKHDLIPKNLRVNICIADVLQKVLGNKNSDSTLFALKLCLYLENYRRLKNYKYFENYENYQPIQTKIQQSIVEYLVKTSFQLIEDNTQGLSKKIEQKIDIVNMHDDLVLLLFHYYCLLTKYQKIEEFLNIHNLWIVKPIASSRGAGIFLLKNSLQYAKIFCSKHEYSHSKKFSNKIIQKYIDTPYLLKSPQNFKERKFDIRHWVLVTCHENNNPIIYIYQEGYCRFSQLTYSLNLPIKNQQKIHLTNYSLYKKGSSPPQNSILMLQEVFAYQPQIKKEEYFTSLQRIVVQTIMNNKELVFERGKFQLFGYDILLDSRQKLWLLEINLNPACQSSRYAKLENEARTMAGDMLGLITRKIKTKAQDTKWKLIYGKDNRKKQISQSPKQRLFTQSLEQLHSELQQMQTSTQIKPFYSNSLDARQSLVEQVRKRNNFMKAIVQILTKLGCKEAWIAIKQVQQKKSEEVEQNEKMKDEKELGKEGPPKND